MLCMGCGAEMRLIAVVPDRELETPGYEHRTHECSGCGEHETRLSFSREPTRPAARRHAPTQPTAPSSDSHATAQPSPPPAPVPPQTIMQEPPGVSLAATARSAWESAVARLRSRESALSEQAESVKKAEHLARFDREWESLAPRRKPSIAAQLAGREPIPVKP